MGHLAVSFYVYFLYQSIIAQRLIDVTELLGKARVVELRVFAGMTGEEIAEALGVARSTVADDWAVARAWLASQMRESGS